MSRTLSLFAWPVVLVLGVFIFGVPCAVALDVPALTGRVVDRADILTPEAEARISSRLEVYERASGHQFAVLTVPNLEGDALESYSIRVVERWKLGKKGKDDGLLLLVVSGERKVRIEVGYGLEGEITDARSSRIIRDIITPAFRRADFAGGIDAALTALMQAASGNAPDVPGPVEPTSGRERQRGGISYSMILWLLLMILPFILPPFFGGRRRRGLGGFFIGGMGGGFPRGGGFGGGGFSGGGGGFGGGGASGRW